MKIAVISSLTKQTNFKAAGGQEIWTASYVYELAKRKYFIELFATAKSIEMKNFIKLQKVIPKGIDEMKKTIFALSNNPSKDVNLYSSYCYSKVALLIMKSLNKFDIIHDCSNNVIFFYKCRII